MSAAPWYKQPKESIMKDDVPRRVAGPAVAAFDAQMEAEESGVLFTPDQWSFARQSSPARLPAPRARGSVPPPAAPMSTTQRIPAETLEGLVEECRKPLADARPDRRK
jgi:hypothetical protein